MGAPRRPRLQPALLSLAAARALPPAARAFSVPSRASAPRTAAPSSPSRPAGAGAGATALRATSYRPVFDFALTDPAAKAKSAASFERIDDAIMGGISTSSFRDVPDAPYARWSGVCRTDGGGFCGARTLPFVAPLDAGGADGVYLECDLVSDDDASRRVWKMSLRTDTSRGEQVYQAEYDLGRAVEEECVMREALEEATEAERALRNAIRVAEEYGAKKEADELKDKGDDLRRAMDDMKEDGQGANEDDACWTRVRIPFDDFKLVRGPRLVPDAPPMNITGGIYQIGMTLSKFRMAQNMTELEDFRAGYFDMRIRSIGFYAAGEGPVASTAAEEGPDRTADVPDTLTKEEAASKRPLLLKLLFPVARLLFSEEANRRRSAMRKLREERGLGRLGAIRFGVRSRRRSMGVIPSVLKTLGILAVDSFRATVFFVLKVLLVYPIRAVRGTMRALGVSAKPSPTE